MNPELRNRIVCRVAQIWAVAGYDGPSAEQVLHLADTFAELLGKGHCLRVDTRPGQPPIGVTIVPPLCRPKTTNPAQP